MEIYNGTHDQALGISISLTPVRKQYYLIVQFAGSVLLNCFSGRQTLGISHPLVEQAATSFMVDLATKHSLEIAAE
ncbi:hypothetical protein [Bradyrhizobium sp. B117]|uniref:hypothetical protein n=1 Tax=Bradyrhizobium sp. B117 TaxID=3140246 RepID=UPI0031837CC7